MPLSRCIWTIEEEKTLRNLLGRMPLGRVASVMGRSKSSIISKASALGVSTRCKTINWNQENLNRLIVFRAQGLSWKEIAKEIGISENGCKSAYHRHQEEIDNLLNLRIEEHLREVMLKYVSSHSCDQVLHELRSDNLTSILRKALSL